MTLRISQKVALSVAVPVALILLFAAWLWQAMGEIGASVKHVRDESLAFAITARDMERSVIQVQQFLSDVSATRAQDGLDDGFREAEKNRQSFIEALERFRKMYTAENAQKELQALQDIESRFNAYYQMGVSMAHAYVDGGPTSGNKLMGDFDKAATSLQGALQPFVGSQVAEASEAIGNSDTLAMRVRNLALLLVLIVLTISSALGWIVVTSISRPIGLMQQAVDGIGNGDLTTNVPALTNDELGVMAGHLNSAMVKLSTAIQEVVTVAGEVAQHAGELAVTTEQLTRSTEEQSAATAHMAANVEQICTSISQVANNAEETQHLSEQALELVGRGGTVVQNAATEMTRIAASVSHSATRINSLSERSSEISGIVGVIKEIADQTNLLALNAAIEAARAGETGRGFAVVADEVRKLAERTALATSEIGKLIDAIRDETAAAVGSMEKSSGQAVTGVQFANEADQLFGQISGSTSQATNHVRDIVQAVREQDVASNDVARNVERIAQMTEENSMATQNVSRSAGQLKSLSSRLQATASRFKT